MIRDVVSGRERAVTSGSDGASLPSWSPDGQWLAFFRFVSEPSSWSPRLPAKPKGANWGPPESVITQLRWAFDGRGLLSPGTNRIFVVSVSGGSSRAVTPTGYFHTSYIYEPEITWSPDSTKIISPAVKSREGWDNVSGGEIFSFPRDGGVPVALTAWSGHKTFVRVSPDGKHIAFAGFPWKGQTYHVAKLHVMDADGRNHRVLTSDWDRDVSSPVWSADSQTLYFLSDDRGANQVHRVALNQAQTAVTKEISRFGGLSISSSGTAVSIISAPTNPGTLMTFTLAAGDKITPIWNPNTEYLSGCPLAPADEIWYESPDRKRIQGWVIKPPSFDPARKYPLIVSIHGGPHGMYGINFMHELQMYAARGYVVLYTNPRGSTGYGEAFGNVIQHKWPGDDIQDVISGADHLIALEYVEPTRMGVIGGSGGGLMTCAMVTRTDRFRAAVALYPVTNWFTHVGSGDNGFYIASVYRPGMPWLFAQDYIERSPLFQVSKVRTPTMIITGEDDWRTPIAQSNEFYRALKVRGVDTVFIRVPGEAHGMRRYPSHRANVIAHGMAWFEKYIPTH
jgi:acylaminoacyl-peptidase